MFQDGNQFNSAKPAHWVFLLCLLVIGLCANTSALAQNRIAIDYDLAASGDGGEVQLAELVIRVTNIGSENLRDVMLTTNASMNSDLNSVAISVGDLLPTTATAITVPININTAIDGVESTDLSWMVDVMLPDGSRSSEVVMGVSSGL